MMERRYRKFSIHLNYPGLTKKTFSWPQYKEFTDALVKALSGMKNGPRPDQIIPEEIKDGSAQPAYSIPEDSLPVVRKLAQGPTRAWTSSEKEKITDLHDWLRSHGAKGTLSVKKGYEHKIIVPLPKELYPIKSYESITGIIWLVGGEKGRVHVRIGQEKTLTCDAGQKLAEDLAKLLYHKVRLSGYCVRSSKDLEVEKFEILCIEHDMGHAGDWEPESILQRQYASIKTIQQKLSSAMDKFDAEKFMNEIRNG